MSRVPQAYVTTTAAHLLVTLTYGRDVASSSGATALAIAVYTALRVLVFLGVWALLWVLTPLDALWSAVAAILISGAISLVLLDRQRGRVGRAAGGFFARINARIDAATRAEDIDEPWPVPVAGSGQGEQGTQGEAVDQQQDASRLQGGNEGRAGGAAQHDSQRDDGQQARQDPEPHDR